MWETHLALEPGDFVKMNSWGFRCLTVPGDPERHFAVGAQQIGSADHRMAG